jgi:hypothetical protein
MNSIIEYFLWLKLHTNANPEAIKKAIGANAPKSTTLSKIKSRLEFSINMDLSPKPPQ